MRILTTKPSKGDATAACLSHRWMEGGRKVQQKGKEAVGVGGGGRTDGQTRGMEGRREEERMQ